MSKSTNATTLPPPCYAHRHMTAAEYGFWDVCRALAHKTDTLYFNGADIAARFESMARSTTYNLAKSLVRKGWFKETKRPKRGAGGLYSARHYKVLSHAEWIAEHPDCCPLPIQFDDYPIQNSALEGDSPIHSGDNPIQFDYSPIYSGDSPVHSGVHNLIEIQLTKKQPTTEQPATPPPVQQMDAFVDRYSPGGKKRAKAAAEAAEAAPALDPRPILKTGLDTARDAEKLAFAITSQLANQNASHTAEWTASIQRLLIAGHTLKTIRSVANFAYSKFGAMVVQRNGPSGFEQHFDQMAVYVRDHQPPAGTAEGAGL